MSELSHRTVGGDTSIGVSNAPEIEVDAAIRQALLRAMTDLYIAKQSHTASEERQFTELALRLIDLVDNETREAVAQKLMRYQKAPAEVLERIASALPDSTASDMPSQEPQDAWRHIARELDDLFFSAEPFERHLILMALGDAAIAPATVIPAESQTIAALERAALERDIDRFAQILERALSISPAAARRIALDSSGEPVLVATLALGVSEAVLQRVLLCLNPTIAQSVQRIYDLASLHREVDPLAARRLISIWRAAYPLNEAVAEPAPAPTPSFSRAKPEARPSALPARPTIRWDEFARRTADGG